MAAQILLVEDDRDLVRILETQLRNEGFEVEVARDGLDALRVYHAIRPELVILDIALPLLEGRAVCQRIREVSDVPILMMTAHAVTEQDIVQGLNLGADEFLVKPIRAMEFVARIRALLRRARSHAAEAGLPNQYEDEHLQVDISNRRVVVQDNEVRLTPTEFKLLALLVQHPDQVMTFQQLLEQVWGFEYQREHHYPRIYVSHLRRKIEPDVKNPTYIQSEYGIGYRFTPQR